MKIQRIAAQLGPLAGGTHRGDYDLSLAPFMQHPQSVNQRHSVGVLRLLA